MPRYFFHLDGPDGCLEDHEGVVAQNLDEALGECLKVIGELRGTPGAARDWEGWTLTMVCEETQVACDIDLQASVKLPVAERRSVVAMPVRARH